MQKAEIGTEPGRTNMIWDRFDDAHDDLLDDIHAIRRRVETLKASLRSAKIEFQPFEKPASNNKPGPQAWYEDTMSEESAWLSYESYLRKLLADGPAADDEKN